jgi:hypothetical protein
MVLALLEQQILAAVAVASQVELAAPAVPVS